jgi:hypothetical protein
MMLILHRQQPDVSAGIFRRASMQEFIACLGAALLSPLVAACSGIEPRHRTPAAPVDVPLLPYIGRLVTLDATVGQRTIRLIFDTAAGETIISPEVASRIGCSPSGRSIGYRMNGDRIAFAKCLNVTMLIGGIAFPHDEIAVWDVKSVLPEDAPPIDGVLSLKTLAKQPFTLQLAGRRITLETHDSYRHRIAGMNHLSSRLATGPDGDELSAFVRGAGPGGAWYLIDSGNLDVVQAAPHLRAMPPNTEGTWEADLKLEGLPAVPATFRTHDIIYDGVLSEAFLRQFILSFDLSANEIWAAPLDQPQT